MTVLVECECGEKFEVSTNLKRHKSNNESASVFVGSKKCPNPQCNRTIYIDAIISTEIDDDSPIITTKSEELGRSDLIDWHKVKGGDSLYHGGLPFEVAHKFIRGEASKKILVLRSLCHEENVIAEVDDCGAISFVPWMPPEDNTFSNINNPCTSSGFETWTEEGLELMIRLKSTKGADSPTPSEKVDSLGDHLDWEYIREGQLIDIGSSHYHVIFKTVWESSKTSDTRRILYLESLANNEHLIAEVEEDGRSSLIFHRDIQSIIPFDVERPYASAGFESWTDEEMEELKKDSNQKLDKTNCQLCGTPVDTQLWENHRGLCEGCYAGINGREEDEWID